MVNENRFGVTSYCKCCAWKIDSIHNMRKNGTTKKEDWIDRPLHKDCWMLIKKFMSIHCGKCKQYVEDIKPSKKKNYLIS